MGLEQESGPALPATADPHSCLSWQRYTGETEPSQTQLYLQLWVSLSLYQQLIQAGEYIMFLNNFFIYEKSTKEILYIFVTKCDMK